MTLAQPFARRATTAHSGASPSCLLRGRISCPGGGDGGRRGLRGKKGEEGARRRDQVWLWSWLVIMIIIMITTKLEGEGEAEALSRMAQTDRCQKVWNVL